MDRVPGCWWVLVGLAVVAAVVVLAGAASVSRPAATLLPQSAAAAVHSKEVEYKNGETVLWGYLAYDDSSEGKQPAVVIVHDWRGAGEFEENVALELAKLGYVAFVVDMYGRHTLKGNPREGGRWAEHFRSHRVEARARFEASLNALRADDVRVPCNVDVERIVAIGYGFGGEICLDMARMGVTLDGVVCFYSSLKNRVPDELRKPITARILVLHGADDKRVPREEVVALEDEMRVVGPRRDSHDETGGFVQAPGTSSDWQLIVYGGAQHAFADPNAGGDGQAYSEPAARRSWEALKAFLAEVFAEASEEKEDQLGQDSQD
jgi:dienelactone hydrolase